MYTLFQVYKQEENGCVDWRFNSSVKLLLAVVPEPPLDQQQFQIDISISYNHRQVLHHYHCSLYSDCIDQNGAINLVLMAGPSLKRVDI